jgi:DNA-binding LacI/PurR family transcriptional regulator
MGRRAVELLYDLEEQPVSKSIVDVVETNLIIRDSTSSIGVSQVAEG